MNSGTDKQRKVLGKGLSALLPARPSRRVADLAADNDTFGSDVATDRRHPPESDAAANRFSGGPAGRAGGFHSRERHHSAPHRSAQWRRVIRSSRGNAGGGQRSWRAWRRCPSWSRKSPIRRMLELALIENIQREDLIPSRPPTPMSASTGRLGLSHEEIGRRTGKDRTSIANTFGLLKLPNEVQSLLAEQRLSMGHARAILGLPTGEMQIEIAEKAAAQGLSVRQVEALVQELTLDRPKKAAEQREAKPGSQCQSRGG